MATLMTCTPLEVHYCSVEETYYEKEVFILLNEYRSSEGLKTLNKDILCANDLAKNHCIYMDSINRLNHDNYQYRTSELHSRGAESVGEIGGRNYGFPIDLINAFKNSERHNRVMLGDYKYIGIGSHNEFITIIFYK